MSDIVARRWIFLYLVLASTVAAIHTTRKEGGRVVAVGTTVVRALEGRALQSGGTLTPGEGVTDLLVGPDLPNS